MVQNYHRDAAGHLRRRTPEKEGGPGLPPSGTRAFDVDGVRRVVSRMLDDKLEVWRDSAGHADDVLDETNGKVIPRTPDEVLIWDGLGAVMPLGYPAITKPIDGVVINEPPTTDYQAVLPVETPELKPDAVVRIAGSIRPGGPRDPQLFGVVTGVEDDEDVAVLLACLCRRPAGGRVARAAGGDPADRRGERSRGRAGGCGGSMRPRCTPGEPFLPLLSCSSSISSCLDDLGPKAPRTSGHRPDPTPAFPLRDLDSQPVHDEGRRTGTPSAAPLTGSTHPVSAP
ncbi:DUF6093 family protein [Streptomyces sp. 11x1]|uniref:DUF6093 family protein n=1 Tax=Streptomyces sp. 11x1 TaxID=3038642 RepID=UPI0037DA5E11